MYARTSNSAEEFPSFIVSDLDGDFESEGFYAGTPVCAQPQRHLESVPFSSFFLILAFTVASAFAADDQTRQEWTSKFERLAGAWTSSGLISSPQQTPAAQDVASTPAPQPMPAASSAPLATAQPLPVVTVANAPGDEQDSKPGDKLAKTHVSEAYAPPPPTTDPYRKKAEAAGLHPDLSRVVLARLTSTDYRNAAFAIDKAVKTVPDEGSLTWPRTRKSGIAVFNVHFVEGAGRDCRRYVVTITKDRWTSTALPMEKCGVKVAFRGEKEKSVE